MTPNSTPQKACPSCGEPLTQGGGYCPFCGAAVSAGTANDVLIKKIIDTELAARLQDQKALVRGLADDVEEIIWRRYTRYTVLIGLLVAVLLGAFSFFGISKVTDVSARIDPIVNDAVAKTKAAEQNIATSAAKADKVKVDIDHLAVALDVQTRRMNTKTGDVAQKMAMFDAARKQMETYLAQSQNLSQQVAGLQSSLQTRVQQISTQMDNISVQRAFPTLGATMTVLLSGQLWKGGPKQPQELLVNLSILPQAYSGYTQARIEKLVGALKEGNYTPFLGMLGVGGPFNTGYYSLDGENSADKILYFAKSQEQQARKLGDLVSKVLSRPIKTKFVDPTLLSSKNDYRKFILDKTGMDFQIVLAD